MKKVFCAIALVMAVMLASTIPAHAAASAWGTSTLQNVLVGAQPSNFAAVAAGGGNTTYTIGAGSGDSLAAGDTITITITGGATWAATPTLTARSTGNNADIGGGANVAAAPLSGGTVGGTTATWRVIDPGAGITAFVLNDSTGNDYNVSALTATSNVDLLMDLKTLLGATIGAAARSYKADTNHYLFSGINAQTITDPATFAVVSDTADVSATTGPYTKFVGGGTTSSVIKLAVTNNSNGSAIPANKAVSANKLLFTLTGDFTGIASIAADGVTGSDAAGSITGGSANSFKIATDKQHAYAVNTAALAGGAALDLAKAGATQFKFTIDGTTQQTTRTFQAGVQVLADTDFVAHSVLANTNWYSITRNGASAQILNIPAVGDPDVAFIRITNTSSSPGKVFGTLYSQAGVQLGPASVQLFKPGTVLGPLGGKTTMVLTAADLQTLFGVSAWTGGRARLEVSMEAPTMKAMGLIRDADSILHNMSAASPVGD